MLIFKNIISHFIMDRTVKRVKQLSAPPLGKSALSKIYFARDVIWVVLATFVFVIYALITKLLPAWKKNLNGKKILITGAGNGLGRELALLLAKHRAVVICVDIEKQGNEETVRDVKKILGSEEMAKGYVCDVADAEGVKKLAEKITEDFGRVDVLINNAGIVYAHNVIGGSEEMIEKVLRVNLLSNFWIVRAFLPLMKTENQGHIVFINSASGIHGMMNGCAYSASKFGLLGFMHSLEEELRHDPSTSNIKLTSVHPYFIRSNKEFSQFWNLRIAPLNLTETASAIIDGIRKELRFFSIPGSDVGYWFLTFTRLVPAKLYHLYRDVFYSDVIVEEGEVSLSDVARGAKNLGRL